MKLDCVSSTTTPSERTKLVWENTWPSCEMQWSLQELPSLLPRLSSSLCLPSLDLARWVQLLRWVVCRRPLPLWVRLHMNQMLPVRLEWLQWLRRPLWAMPPKCAASRQRARNSLWMNTPLISTRPGSCTLNTPKTNKYRKKQIKRPARVFLFECKGLKKLIAMNSPLISGA